MVISPVTLVGTSLPRAVGWLYPDIVFRTSAREQTAYLTFDDGPNPQLTPRILDILDRHRARATFFLLGSRAERNPELVRAIIQAGHGVGNHTFSHPDPWRAPAADVIRELDRTTVLLDHLCGRPPAWMRPPYGHFTRPIRDWCSRRRQKLIMWDLGPGDFLASISSANVVRHVTSYVRPGSIIVLHDNPRCRATTPEALESVLARLTDDGWRFPMLPIFG